MPKQASVSRAWWIWMLPLLCCGGIATRADAADSVLSPARQVTRIAEGVYEIRHKDPFPGWVTGNTTVIIGTQAVFVVDACQLPSDAREDIAQIRQWTDKPVRYLLNTHWHSDHNGGNQAYAEAYPGVAIVAHDETRQMMDAGGPGVPALWLKDVDLTRANIAHALDTGLHSTGTPLTDAERQEARAALKDLDRVASEAAHYRYQAPNLTFTQALDIDLGGIEVQVRHLGRANTGGDAVVYLPARKLLVTGDIVVHPVPYTYDGYPSEWVRTLEALMALPADTIVPGHGEVLHDMQYLRTLRDMMQSTVTQVDAQFSRNIEASLDDVKKAVDLHEFRDRIAAGDKDSAAFFDDSVIGHFVELAYHERKQR